MTVPSVLVRMLVVMYNNMHTAEYLIKEESVINVRFFSIAEGVQHFQVTALLDMLPHQYASQSQHIRDMCKALVEDAGLIPRYNNFSRCNSSQ